VAKSLYAPEPDAQNLEVNDMMFTALLTSVLMLACAAPSLAQRNDFKERDETNQTFELSPGARVEISSIRGSVKIVNADTATAEVRIIRTARTRADLEYHKIEVTHSGNSLVVRGIQEPEERRERNVQVDHQVMLTLPRRIDLSAKSISGSVRAGDVDGRVNVSSVSGSVNISNITGKLEVNSVSGSVEVGNAGADVRVNSVSGNVGMGQVDGSLEVSSVSGGVKATLNSLSPQGIHIKSVSGSIEIGFKSDVNADFNAEGISGQVYLDVPNVVRDSEEKSPNVRARIGAGGTPISIFSVSGNIRLTRS
jgi:DUF4097 and DUF4098 domain-containing protein YvlB